MKKIALFCSLFLLLVGCTAPTLQQPTAAFTQNKQPTFTLRPSPTITRTPYPTNAVLQTATPLPLPTLTSTPDLAATVMAIEQAKLYATYPSPNGMWRVDIITYDCAKTTKTEEGGWIENAYEQVILVNLASGEKQVADDQLQYCGGLGAAGFEGLYWSPDSRFFYYTPARQGVPEGCGYWQKPIFRFEVPALANREDLGMGARSPDGEKIATWNWPDNTLTIWYIDDVAHFHFSPLYPEAEIGPIAWSADSQALVYLKVDSWCPLSGKSYLVQVDISKLDQTQLLESESPTFGNVEWSTSNTLRLFDQDGKEWNFDISTHELTQNP